MLKIKTSSDNSLKLPKALLSTAVVTLELLIESKNKLVKARTFNSIHYLTTHRKLASKKMAWCNNHLTSQVMGRKMNFSTVMIKVRLPKICTMTFLCKISLMRKITNSGLQAKNKLIKLGLQERYSQIDKWWLFQIQSKWIIWKTLTSIWNSMKISNRVPPQFRRIRS